MTHIWMSHDTHINESCHAYEWVMSRIWMSHVAHGNKPSLTVRHDSTIVDPAYYYVSYHSFICVTCLIHLRDMPDSYVCRDSIICVAWLIYLCDRTRESWEEVRGTRVVQVECWVDDARMGSLTHTCETWLNHWGPDLFPCAIWLIVMCVMTHSYICHNSLICVTWLRRVGRRSRCAHCRPPSQRVGCKSMCDVTHSYVWHEFFIC